MYLLSLEWIKVVMKSAHQMSEIIDSALCCVLLFSAILKLQLVQAQGMYILSTIFAHYNVF